MRLGALFSGGKDSCLALHLAKKQGHDICFLLSIIPSNFDSFMFHKPYLNLLKKQAEMLGIDLITINSSGDENNEIEDLYKLINSVKDKIDGVLVGGIASRYQKKRIKNICDKLNLKFFSPLWSYSDKKIWKEIFTCGFKVILTKISCEGISKDFLGKIINKEEYNKLKKLSQKYKFRLDFEGGEAESAVLFMPEFKEEIKIKYEIIDEGKYRSYLNIKKVYN
ncbi:MAG: diphthine--ammonia ligase [Candidatus Pacearchaeota archaeon]